MSSWLVAAFFVAQLQVMAPVGSAELARQHFDRGAALFAERDLAASRLAFETAVGVFDALDDAIGSSLAREALARVLIEQGEFLGADDVLRAAMARIEPVLASPHPHRARLKALAALVQQGMADFDAARALHEAALAEYRQLHGNQHLRVAAMLQNYATLSSAAGESSLTSVLLDQARDIVVRNSGPHDPQLARTLVTSAHWDWRRGDVVSARADYEAALAVQTTGAGLAHPDRLEPLRGLGRCDLAEGRDEAAVAVLSEAAALYQRVWPSGGEDLERATAFDSPLLELALAQLKTGREIEAWITWEEHAGRTLDNPPHAEVTTGVPLPATLAAHLAPDTSWVGWLEVESAPGRASRFAWILTRAKGLRWIDLGTAPLDGLEMQLRASFRLATASAPHREDVQRVHARWFEALRPALEASDHLVFLPSGSLVGIPLEILTDAQGSGVGTRWTTSYAPSVSSLLPTLEASVTVTPRSRTLLALADPVLPRVNAALAPSLSDDAAPWVLRSAAAGNPAALATLAPLHETRREVESLSKWFATPLVLVGAEATEARLRQALDGASGRSFDVVHIATHALIDPLAPARSALVLSGAGTPGAAPEADGLIRMRDVLDEWQLDTELVTLSACETGLGRSTSTDGMLGFPQALLRVGARSVLVTQWKVDDRATSLFMQEFYRTWLATEPPVSRAVALQRAREHVRTWTNGAGRRPFEDLRYWGAFVLVGDWR